MWHVFVEIPDSDWKSEEIRGSYGPVCAAYSPYRCTDYLDGHTNKELRPKITLLHVKTCSARDMQEMGHWLRSKLVIECFAEN